MNNKKIFFISAIFLTCLLLVLAIYLLFSVYRSMDIYNYFEPEQPKSIDSPTTFVGNAFEIDRKYGYVASKNSTYDVLVPLGSPIHHYNDINGFRAPLSMQYNSKNKLAKGPSVMFFGDSFSYGLYVRVEDTFPYLLPYRTINASVPGYSLAQMLMRAKELVPIFKPDYIVVQYSPWLVERVVRGYAETKIPIRAPYFYEKKGSLHIHPTIYLPPDKSLPNYLKPNKNKKISKYKHIFYIGLPLIIKDDFYSLLFNVQNFIGRKSKIYQNKDEIIKYAFSEFNILSHKNNSSLIILGLGSSVPNWPFDFPVHLFPKYGATVNAWQAMLNEIDDKNPTGYILNYYHWRGQPPQVVDAHPNEKAHQVISAALTNVIEQLEDRKRREHFDLIITDDNVLHSP